MISLYRKGNTHVIRGTLCQMQQFDVNELEWAQSEGWLTDPKMIAELEKPKAKAKSPKKSKGE